MRIRSRGTATVTMAALATVAVTGVTFAPSATADARNAGATTGRVCMFDAPKGALHLGHVAWAFRWYDGSGGLNGLPDGKLVFPNAYFNYDLTGWEDAKAL